MEEIYTYIDFDGVILDSDQRMLERKYMVGFQNHEDENQFDAYFDYTNLHPEEWDYIINEAKSINDSVEIIKELQQLNKKIAILTKVHTLYEMKIKVNDLRNHRKIYVPVIFVPPGIKKHEIIMPKDQLLIDDYPKNIIGWIEHGGCGLIFDKTAEQDSVTKIRSLELLLKR